MTEALVDAAAVLPTAARVFGIARCCQGGCRDCSAGWSGGGAKAAAAAHHDATGHRSWFEDVTRVRYGDAG